MTTRVAYDGREIEKDVKICDASWKDWKAMEQKAVIPNGIDEGRLIMCQGKIRWAAVVEALKGGITLGDTSEKPGEPSAVGGHVEGE